MHIIFISNVFRDYLYYPLGLLYLSSSLKKNGHDIELIDGHDLNQVIKKVSELRPKVIAFSITTGYHQVYQYLNLQLKKRVPNTFISVFGGPHPTFFPDMIQDEGVDAICRGEGEVAFIEFVKKIDNNEDYSKTKNFWVKINNKIIRNKVRPKIPNLDNIAFPDIHLLGEKILKNFFSRFVIVSRGCLFKCPYCFNHAYNKLYDNNLILRIRSVDNVIKELISYKDRRNGIMKSVKFMDDNFVVQKDWLVNFTREYKKHIGMPFNCLLRPEFINAENISLLKKAGCNEIIMGIEAGNELIRKEVLERDVSNEKIIEAAHIIKKYGLLLTTENMVGLPHETLDQAMETISINIKCKTDVPVASIYTPYPGTKMGEYAISHPIFGINLNRKTYINSIGHTYFDESILNIPDKLKKENISKLFALMVRHPRLIPLFKKLINLNIPHLYSMCFRIQFGYLSLKKHGKRLMSFSSTIKLIFRTLLHKTY